VHFSEQKSRIHSQKFKNTVGRNKMQKLKSLRRLEKLFFSLGDREKKVFTFWVRTWLDAYEDERVSRPRHRWCLAYPGLLPTVLVTSSLVLWSRLPYSLPLLRRLDPSKPTLLCRPRRRRQFNSRRVLAHTAARNRTGGLLWKQQIGKWITTFSFVCFCARWVRHIHSLSRCFCLPK